MPLFNKTDDGALYAADSQDECATYLGRACKPNVLVDSGIFSSRNGRTALEAIGTIPTFVKWPSQTIGSNSEQQQQTQQSVAGTVKPSAETKQSSIQSSDVESVWASTTSNFGVGRLD